MTKHTKQDVVFEEVTFQGIQMKSTLAFLVICTVDLIITSYPVCSICTQRAMEERPSRLRHIQPQNMRRGRLAVCDGAAQELFCLRLRMRLQFHCCKGQCRGPVSPLIQLSNREMNSNDADHLSALSGICFWPTPGFLLEPLRVYRQKSLSSSHPQPHPLLLTLEDKWKLQEVVMGI